MSAICTAFFPPLFSELQLFFSTTRNSNSQQHQQQQQHQRQRQAADGRVLTTARRRPATATTSCCPRDGRAHCGKTMVSHGSGGSTTLVLGGETASLLDAPRAPPEGNPFSRAFETGGGRGGYTVIEEGTGGGPEGKSIRLETKYLFSFLETPCRQHSLLHCYCLLVRLVYMQGIRCPRGQ